MALVLVHEMGHFFVARWCGMRVERFSIFFGKPLVHWTRGETQYRLGWLPLGGYVKISGMTPDEDVPAEAVGRTYSASSPWRKIATIAAGPAVNLVVAVLCVSGAFWIGLPDTIGSSDRVRAVAATSPAASIGLERGDRLVAVNGVRSRPGPAGKDPLIVNVDPLRDELQKNANKSVAVTFEHNGELITKNVVLTEGKDEKDRTVGRLGFEFQTIDRTVRSGPIEGLRQGLDRTWFFTTENVKGVGRLFTSAEARKQTGTVARIGAVYNETTGLGLGTTVGFIGIISLLLCIYNLLPVLPLDGGHILSAIVEKIRGRPLSRRALEASAAVGLVLIALLFFTAVRNDVLHFSGRTP